MATKGTLVNYDELYNVLKYIEVYKFRVLRTFSIDHTFTFTIDIKNIFGLTLPTSSYEIGGIAIPYRSYQTGGWFPVYNRWWTNQTVTDGNLRFTFNRESAGYWGTPYNKKWFSVVVWVKPITTAAKEELLPNDILKDKEHTIATWQQILDTYSVSASDTLKSHRFSPASGGTTDIPFTNFFSSFDPDIHRISIIPSIQKLSTIEDYGVVDNSDMSLDSLVNSSNVYSPSNGVISNSAIVLDNSGSWLHINNSAINSSREIEFFMFKGLK